MVINVEIFITLNTHDICISRVINEYSHEPMYTAHSVNINFECDPQVETG